MAERGCGCKGTEKKEKRAAPSGNGKSTSAEDDEYVPEAQDPDVEDSEDDASADEYAGLAPGDRLGITAYEYARSSRGNCFVCVGHKLPDPLCAIRDAVLKLWWRQPRSGVEKSLSSHRQQSVRVFWEQSFQRFSTCQKRIGTCFMMYTMH